MTRNRFGSTDDVRSDRSARRLLTLGVPELARASQAALAPPLLRPGRLTTS